MSDSNGTLDLRPLKSPEMQVMLPNGEKKTFDLYELNEKLAKVTVPETDDGGADLGPYYDAIRAAFGFPSEAFVATAMGEPRSSGDNSPEPFTLSRHHCEVLKTTVYERVAALPERQRFFELQRKFSTAFQGSPIPTSRQ